MEEGAKDDEFKDVANRRLKRKYAIEDFGRDKMRKINKSEKNGIARK